MKVKRARNFRFSAYFLPDVLLMKNGNFPRLSYSDSSSAMAPLSPLEYDDETLISTRATPIEPKNSVIKWLAKVKRCDGVEKLFIIYSNELFLLVHFTPLSIGSIGKRSNIQSWRAWVCRWKVEWSIFCIDSVTRSAASVMMMRGDEKREKDAKFKSSTSTLASFSSFSHGIHASFHSIYRSIELLLESYDGKSIKLSDIILGRGKKGEKLCGKSVEMNFFLFSSFLCFFPHGIVYPPAGRNVDSSNGEDGRSIKFEMRQQHEFYNKVLRSAYEYCSQAYHQSQSKSISMIVMENFP